MYKKKRVLKTLSIQKADGKMFVKLTATECIRDLK